jgi:hypothetical protein
MQWSKTTIEAEEVQGRIKIVGMNAMKIRQRLLLVILKLFDIWIHGMKILQGEPKKEIFCDFGPNFSTKKIIKITV